MNKNLSRIVTYFKMTLLFTVLGAAFLYFAGTPLVNYLISEGNMLIVKGSPADPGKSNPELSKLIMEDSGASNLSEIRVPELETQFGTITCDRIALSAPVYYGDSDGVLQKGVGQYPNQVLPGQGKPMLMSGHDVTFFEPLEQIKIGDIVIVTTDYGKFHYSVVDKKVAASSDSAAYDLTQDREQLILYTCYPFGQLVGDRKQRFFVYCNRVTEGTQE